MSSDFLPYGRQQIDDDDIAAVAEALRSDYLTTGPRVTAFEEAFATRMGVKRAIACANGTAALHAAMLALDIGPGDVAIVPSITFLATANAARFCNGWVMFADVDPATGLMTPESLTEAIIRTHAIGMTPRVVIPVHYAGQICDMPALSRIARDNGMFIVEDACHALGSIDSEGFTVGACEDSDMACFSFHPVKTIATGEGGMITTNDPELEKRLRRAVCHGMVREEADLTDPGLSCDAEGTRLPWAYEMQALGYNYRLSDIQAALGLSQLTKLDQFIARRRHLAGLYDEQLNDLSHLTPMSHLVGQSPSLHLYVVQIDFEALNKPRQQVMAELANKGVGTQVHYIPVHHQPYYKRLDAELELPGSDTFYARCLSLPLFPTMKDKDVTRVVNALRDVLVE
ncbi:MAG: UDP-4-amino-4,6-dideoxy-N-acetyl-beta-L-altrosamine transaminase [Hirschia sp.]|nr:UDP-4-amino-4,6-dideoxy-N-acetyl-beta-L-altrosamine transaminase [Hirschia sp.]MBF19070.1 UDP-4-amino-4,6-dideoxy-N-acetyl-beta-L-altrosamine transaminase [Hirschia sp.]MBF20204.1 UDP-4-amino-4,6-dideoxy-N-acetyl-beta-L-altrosamine transaminase [Hirschia sp.]|tara:strand:+ start:176 stop:1375 length:1200 start_codon:yes stop_codon:yes gene_type:complete